MERLHGICGETTSELRAKPNQQQNQFFAKPLSHHAGQNQIMYPSDQGKRLCFYIYCLLYLWMNVYNVKPIVILVLYKTEDDVVPLT